MRCVKKTLKFIQITQFSKMFNFKHLKELRIHRDLLSFEVEDKIHFRIKFVVNKYIFNHFLIKYCII